MVLQVEQVFKLNWGRRKTEEFELFRQKTLRPILTAAEGMILGTAAKMFSCCGVRQLPCRWGGCVICRPRPLARLLPPATGSSRLAPHRRPGDRVRC